MISFKEANEIRLQATREAPIDSTFVLRMRGSHAVYGDFKAELEIGVGGVI